MKKISVAFLLLAMFTGCTPGKKNQDANSSAAVTKTFSYSDGNGNSYKISSESFEYIPVKPEESSTGNYSGGTPVKIKPTREKFQKLAVLIQAASDAKSDHTDERGKGTARVETREGGSSSSFILRMGSDWIQQIEAVLADLKDDK